ncbi:MAG: hypothetical protein V4568_13330 [Pseudomonadota bacterium]
MNSSHFAPAAVIFCILMGGAVGARGDVAVTQSTSGEIKLECTASEGVLQANCDQLAALTKQLNDKQAACRVDGNNKGGFSSKRLISIAVAF